MVLQSKLLISCCHIAKRDIIVLIQLYLTNKERYNCTDAVILNKERYNCTDTVILNKQREI